MNSAKTTKSKNVEKTELSKNAEKIETPIIDEKKENNIFKCNFRMKGSSDIQQDLIDFASKNINRKRGFDEINNYIKNTSLSKEIEDGLFEASLLHITIKKQDISTVTNVYGYKLCLICKNLDINDEHIQNKTLLNMIKNKETNAYMTAFLSPQQMHPEKWETYNQRKIREDDAMYNPETTDEYECSKCKERKSTVEYIQLRGADEPANKFIVCVVCGTTVIE